MVSEGRGRLFRRPDGKYLIYLPVYFAEDSMFPLKPTDTGPRGGQDSLEIKGTFKIGEKQLVFSSLGDQKRKVSEEGIVSDRCRLFARKDGKFLIYLSTDWAEDSMFPFKGSDSILVKVSFKPGGAKRLVVEKWEEPEASA